MSEFIKLIPKGAGSAVKMSDLTSLSGLSVREVYKQIETLRKQKVVICAGDEGYYIPITKAELERYVKRANARIRAESVALFPARELLREWKLNEEFAPLSRLDEIEGGENG